jgi:2-haloacid dehalogenase/putative hydrolase of the HAD superfamily
MPIPYDVITFDCYGTLIDWEGGIVGAFQTAARSDGVVLDREQILRAHTEIEPQVQREGYRRYRDVLTEVAVRAAPQLGWRLAPERARFLADSLTGWRPFADTNPALERLRAAGYQLGILSNIDDDLLAGTRKHFTVPFDILVTAEQVRSYKPAAGHFRTARELIGARRWLHAGQSWFHDVEACCAQGIPVVWVNRKRERATGSARPTGEVTDLLGLVDWLSNGS